MVIGRKNHYGSRSRRGTEVAALFYSLIESAKLCGVEPKAYLLRALRTALATPGTATLPHSLAPWDLRSLARTPEPNDGVSRVVTLKVELVHNAAWPTRTVARAELFEYLEVFYNAQRRHSALGYLSPRAFEQQREHEALAT
jgi:Integrase core domain